MEDDSELRRSGTPNVGSAAPPALYNLGHPSPSPSGAGLKFGYRPYGPGSDLRFIAGYHTSLLGPVPLANETVAGAKALIAGVLYGTAEAVP